MRMSVMSMLYGTTRNSQRAIIFIKLILMKNSLLKWQVTSMTLNLLCTDSRSWNLAATYENVWGNGFEISCLWQIHNVPSCGYKYEIVQELKEIYEMCISMKLWFDHDRHCRPTTHSSRTCALRLTHLLKDHFKNTHLSRET